MAVPAGDGDFYRRLAEHAGLAFAELGEPDRAAGKLLPEWVARAYGMVPVREEGKAIVVAVTDPNNEVGLSAAEALTNRRVVAEVASPEALVAAQEELYGPPTPGPESRPPMAIRERAREAGIHSRDLNPFERQGEVVDPVNPVAARMVSEGVCRSHRVIPVSWNNGVMTLATADPWDAAALRTVRKSSGQEPRVVLASPDAIDRALDRVYGGMAPERHLHVVTEEDAPAAAAVPVPRPAAAPPVPREPKAGYVMPAHMRIGELLRDRGEVTEAELADALELQQQYGDRLGEVLVHTGVLPEARLMTVLAEQLRLTFTDLGSFEPEPEAVDCLPYEVAQAQRVAPLAVVDGTLYVAMADTLDEDALRALHEHAGMPVKTIVASPSAVESLLDRQHSDKNVHIATRRLLENSPENSAHFVLSRGQRVFFLVLLLLGLIALVIAPILTVIVFNVASILFYLTFSVYRFKLIYNALAHDLELPVSQDEIDDLDERDLPIYTILIPLYREAAVAAKLAMNLAALDYPPTKLDVKLLLEAEDTETIDALRAMNLPPHFKMLIVPDAQPKTKPKACNYGLTQARGEYVVIFDAEDVPDPDQLKKVVIAFRKSEDRIVCIQCKLNYYNRNQNMLTRWFTTEYSMWFDLFMPGLDAADCPIPLGGTSNHFVRDRLIELGGWDPFNVTEDADLGIRLHKGGYKTAIADSTTFEEANSDLLNWIRQRSRWVKGYIQTWLVQMRHPIKLWREIGLRRWFSFQLVVGGTFLVFLLNPIYWILTTLWLLTEAEVIRSMFPSLLYYAAAFGLFVGNFVFAYVTAAGCARRGYDGLVKYALLSPIYWGLMSVGAWKGLIQLFFKPFYWEKTEHGLDLPAEAAAHQQQAA